jgi:hypothetical protein
MRSDTRLLAALASAWLVLGPSGAAGFEPSPHRVTTPDPGPCDVIVTEANAASTLSLATLNDPDLRVFCVEPGDYRSAGTLRLIRSGTPESPRFLRLHVADGRENAVQRAERALFHALRIRGSWWVVQQLTVQPREDPAPWYVGIEGGDDNVIEGCLVDGVEHLTTIGAVGIAVADYRGDPATRNVIQDNVLRRGNQARQPVDYAGVAIKDADELGADNDLNRVVDNEISDWGDGVAVVGVHPDCNFPGRPHGTVIDGNDIYLTADKRVDCATGAPDPDGDCACAENGVDVKPDPGPHPGAWTRLTNNRFWGFRPTREPSCGGSGSDGQAVTAGNQCAGHVLVAGNVFSDVRTAIKPSGPSWIVAGNLLHDLVSGIVTQPDGSALAIGFNTIVRVDSAYDDMSEDTDTRCNAVIENLALAGYGGPRGAGHSTEYNHLYRSPVANFGYGTNQVYATAEESRNGVWCYWRKRWTAPERVCVELARATPESPHRTGLEHCDAELGVAFGLAPLSYHSVQAVPEPEAGLLALGALLGGAACAARRSRRRPR